MHNDQLQPSARPRNALHSQRLGAPVTRPAPLVERHGRSRRRTRSAAAAAAVLRLRLRWQGRWSREPPATAACTSSVARASGLYRRFCALSLSTFRAQAPGSSCTGITTEANSPFGAYAAEGIAVTFFTQITNLNAVPFTLELNNDEPEDFTGGALVGSDKREFSLQGTSPPAAPFALNNLDIQWCPDQNYFQVTLFGVTNTLRSQGSTSGSSCDVVESWSVLPPRA